MIQGVVNASHEAVVRLRVRGPGGVESDVDVIVDSVVQQQRESDEGFPIPDAVRAPNRRGLRLRM